MKWVRHERWATVIGTFGVLAVFGAACEAAEKKGNRMITVTSEAFKSGEPIPKKYSEDGSDVSPPLSWQNVPTAAKELALICDDPDAPTSEPWVHWLIYKIPADTNKLPEGVAADAELKSPAGARQGKNSWKMGKTVGYRGPAPPKGHGVHHYHFHLYALDAPLSIESKADKKQLLGAMKGHVLAEGELVGTYERK